MVLLLLHKFCLGNFWLLIFICFTLSIRISICVLRLKFSKLCNQFNWAVKHSITHCPFEQPTDSVQSKMLHENAHSQMTTDGFLTMYSQRTNKRLEKSFLNLKYNFLVFISTWEDPLLKLSYKPLCRKQKVLICYGQNRKIKWNSF